ESTVTLLPQPDSPTMPSVSPGTTSNETPSTARVTPSAVKKWVRRSRTLSSGSATGATHPPREARVEAVAQPVADQVDGEHDQRQRGAGRENRPRRAAQEQPALRD